jgi:protein-S-isoprenylcysteine O-methyltransferase Ste14
MSGPVDRSNVVVHPPIAWALAIVAGVGLRLLHPLPFVPASVARAWIGGGVLAVGFALAIWAILAIRKAGTRVETNLPTTAIVSDGPYRFTRNPIYFGMFLGQIGLAIGFDNFWMLVTLVPFYLVIRHGVVAREEAYLARKFGAVYLNYKLRVRRWL